MKKRQRNKIRMFKATEEICDNNTSTWTPIAAFGTAFALYSGKIAEIDDLLVKQETDLKGITENKNNKESALIRLGLSIANPMVAYANVSNNPQLRQEVDYSEDALKKSSDSDLETKCTLIKERADANAAALAVYGVTAFMIASLGTALTDYNSVITGPRTAIAVRKQQTKDIGLLIKETDNILKGQLDQLIILFQVSAQEFYGSYKNARIIVDLGGHVNTYEDTAPKNSIKTILKTATRDSKLYEISVKGSEWLDFGRGSNSGDMGTPVRVLAGEKIQILASALGPSGNKYLNVMNPNSTDITYRVVRL